MFKDQQKIINNSVSVNDILSFKAESSSRQRVEEKIYITAVSSSFRRIY